MKKLLLAIIAISCILCLCACGASPVPKIEDVLNSEEPWYQTEAELTRADLAKKWGQPETAEEKRDIWNVNGKYVAVWYDGDAVISINRSYSMRAEITEISGDLAIIKPAEGQWELSSGDQIFFSLSWLSEEDAKQAQVGTMLVMEYDGMLMETYPMQINRPYYVAIEE